MQSRRINAITVLKCLAENLNKCKTVLSERPWEGELDETCIWVVNDGTKSSLPEINKRIEDIKWKVHYGLQFFRLLMSLRGTSLAQLVVMK